MRIDVTQEDIDRGVRSDCRACPIALAVERAANQRADADSFAIALLDPDGFPELQVMTPDVASDFMVAFDAGDPVQPFSFDLPLEP